MFLKMFSTEQASLPIYFAAFEQVSLFSIQRIQVARHALGWSDV